MKSTRTFKQGCKHSFKVASIIAGSIIALFVLLVILTNTVWYTAPAPVAVQSEKATVLPTVAPTTVPTVKPTAIPTVRPTVVPTAVPTPTASEIEATYKLLTTDTTVTDIDKDGAQDKGDDQHFTAVIYNLVKDAAGNTGGANVTDPAGSTSDVQVIFPDGTDVSQLNAGDTIEVWGSNQGVFSGQNAFGGTIQEVGVAALYLTDTTTGYSI